MRKSILINEKQLKKFVGITLNEDFTNDISSLCDIFIRSILSGGILYDTNAPDIEEHQPTLVVKSNEYTIYLLGTTNVEPKITPYNDGNYNTPPEGGDVEWNPTMFYLEQVYAIFKNGNANSGEDIGEEETQAIDNCLRNRIKEIPINRNYQIVINQEYSDEPDDFDIEPYDDYRDI